MEKETKEIPMMASVTSQVSSVVDEPHKHQQVDGADKALELIDGETLDFSPEEEKKVLRKIDMFVLPWLFSMYFFQFLDKQTLTYTAIMGLKEDCNLKGSEYSWVGSIYYGTFLISAYPHSRMMQIFSESKYVSFFGMLWGATLMCMAACHSFGGLMTVRALMGVLESPTVTGLVLITGKWYRKYEQSTRSGMWFTSVGFASMLGSILAFSAYRGHQETNVTYASWRILSLGIGSSTVVWGGCMFLFMAESPIKAKYFSDRERRIAIERLRDNQHGVGSHEFKWDQFRECLLDVRTWIYFLFMVTSQIPVGGIQVFASQMLVSYGFGTDITLLVQTLPSGFLQIICAFGFGWIGDKYRNRTLAFFLCMLMSIFGMGLMVGLQNVGSLYRKEVQLVAYIILMGSSATPFALISAISASNVVGHTKKTTTNGIIFTGLAVAYFIGPQVFDDGPKYLRAKVVALILWVITVILLGSYFVLNKWENKRRDKKQLESPMEKPDNIEFMDLTDKQNPFFRYVY
ncbi:hypothetical protein PGUG_05166 [Meyerozyma guilliermondii ATCC 6260]|uniref:Major facilitator superfamily (MFS) profile domain-containing protein n=1 Tax=Meyerozyma guilliermondii (strain ATCC 6260 / CBS 566 / DSM 6381 / JCM 1539 / NBRC 10279 / NRRL Y-324) TaxID=294746 RepID=A5DPG5_PICGU|nr:uncharacterized protein PGUG_05166 [Meyerozyma guilliermondii ATCC 6260]EDK41068.2 hypothetical protein PGUG_05166 [Meyerozyma guilliermondii ATCC 6260]